MLWKKNDFPNNIVYADKLAYWNQPTDGNFDKCRKSAIKINFLPQWPCYFCETFLLRHGLYVKTFSKMYTFSFSELTSLVHKKQACATGADTCVYISNTQMEHR
jgi:hypothetical protein